MVVRSYFLLLVFFLCFGCGEIKFEHAERPGLKDADAEKNQKSNDANEDEGDGSKKEEDDLKPDNDDKVSHEGEPEQGEAGASEESGKSEGTKDDDASPIEDEPDPETEPKDIQESGDRPWIHDSKTSSIKYVSVSGSGDRTGVDKNNTLAWQDAVQSSQIDVTYYVLPGTYSGEFDLKTNASKDMPIIFRSLTPFAAVIQGRIEINGSYNWIWGFRFHHPSYSSPDTPAALNANAEGAHLINNLIHHNRSMQGIAGWDRLKDHVYYGNIVVRNGDESPFVIGHIKPDGNGFTCRFKNPHGLYTQNRFDTNGYKYIVNNMFLENGITTNSSTIPPDADKFCKWRDNPSTPDRDEWQEMKAMAGKPCAACYNVHAYATQAHLSGFVFKNNVVAEGGFILGGESSMPVPATLNALDNNYFYKSSLRLGYNKTGQFKLTNNYTYRTKIEWMRFWGNGEVNYVNDKSVNPACYSDNGDFCYYKSEPNIVTQNTFIADSPGTGYLWFDSHAYTDPGKAFGKYDGSWEVTIDANDVWDQNTYIPDFFGNYGNRGWIRGMDEWKKLIENLSGGNSNRFDGQSQLVPYPTKPKVIMLSNDYNPNRLDLVVYNWGAHAQAVVSAAEISRYFNSGDEISVFLAEELHQSPINKVAVKSGQDVAIPLLDKEFAVFVILRN